MMLSMLYVVCSAAAPSLLSPSRTSLPVNDLCLSCDRSLVALAIPSLAHSYAGDCSAIDVILQGIDVALATHTLFFGYKSIARSTSSGKCVSASSNL